MKTEAHFNCAHFEHVAFQTEEIPARISIDLSTDMRPESIIGEIGHRAAFYVVCLQTSKMMVLSSKTGIDTHAHRVEIFMNDMVHIDS